MLKSLSILMLLLFLHLERGSIRANAQGVIAEGVRLKAKLKDLFDNRPMSELVFVLDSSGSIAESDFYVAVEFIKFASTLISVSASTTRVAVISYSSCDQIPIRVDYIRSPVDKNKCTFNNDLNSVEYHPGGRCTAGALQVGRDVLSDGRPGAQRVLVLITNGPSDDGGSPIKNAQNLRSDGVKIFTIGIGNINLEELNAIATNVDDYVYILADFGQISNLGTVVKDDIRDFNTYFDTMREDQCDSMCVGGANCCDNRAACACAIRSGSTLCACEAGFTGDGLSCEECLIGTYKTAYGDGPCTPCPQYSTTTSRRSRSKSDCQCLIGYEGNPAEDGGICQSIRCPDLNNANINGVIMDECDTTFGSTCQFQCRDEYRPMAGQEQITCLATKRWSGTPLQCEKITCGLLPDLNHAVRTCNSPDRIIGTVCELQCEPGYEFKQGAVINVTCQRGSEISAHWSTEDDEQDPCKKVPCPVLSVDNAKRIHPAGICLESPKFEQVCTYDCKSGYRAEGNVDSVTCLADGTWSVPAADITCRDIEPPTLTCPEDISNRTDLFMPTSTLKWNVHDATDNTSTPVKLRATHSPPYRFDIGTTVVTYSGTDLAGNVANCSFTVTVRDEEPPRPTNCTSDVVVRATDPSGNTQDCNDTIRMSNYVCQYYPPPLNGAVACVNSAGGQLCSVSCQSNFHFTGVRVPIYACIANESGQYMWSGFGGTNKTPEMPWPDCARRTPPGGAIIKSGFRYERSCFDDTSQNKIRANFMMVFDYLQRTGALGPCGQSDAQCSCENVVVQCGQTQRRKRWQVIDGSSGTDVFEITFTLLVEMTEIAGPDVKVLDYLDVAVSSVQDTVANGNVTINVDGIELSLSDDPIEIKPDYSTLCDVGHVPSNGSCEVSCPVLSVDNPKRIHPADICLGIPKFEQVCTYDCKSGYRAEGNVDSVTCLADGTWSVPAANITCRDIEPPTLTCPEDISNPTDLSMPTSTIEWEVPNATDNTGIPVKLQATHSPPYRFDIGTTVVTYSGTDLAGNVATCSFTVTVRDEEPPRLMNCTSHVSFQDLGLDPAGFLIIDEEDWNTSQFEDNSGSLSVETLGVPLGSRFPLGETEVVARATDPSGNTQDCNVTIRVSNYVCEYYPPPLNGAVACVNSAGGQLCKVSCRKKHDFTGEIEDIYACIANESGQHMWSGISGNNEPLAMPWPDCARRRSYGGGRIKSGFRYDRSCLADKTRNKIRANFITVFNHLKITGRLGLCRHESDAQCSFENVIVQCGQIY